MLGIDAFCATPSAEGVEEAELTPGECKRKRRQSVGGKLHLVEVQQFTFM